MSADDKIFAGSIPENYDRHMVPLIFESFAGDIAQRAAALSPKAVLEMAAGSGVVTRALAPMLSPDARYVATDLNQPMLDHAAARQGRDDRISWQKVDAQALPFEDAAFDAATIGFGIRNVDDLDAGLRELARVVRPGGRLAVLEITRPRGVLRPFFRLWFDVLIPLAGKVLPGGVAYSYLPASVRRFPGPDDLADALRRAGFVDVSYRLLAGGIVSLHVGRR